jgi:hypothetical protein
MKCLSERKSKLTKTQVASGSIVMSRYRVICVLMLLLLAVPVMGQSTKADRPNFTGTWILDRSKEDVPTVANLTLVIDHSDPEIKISRKLASQLLRRQEVLKYYSDGRGETNVDNSNTISTKTKWDGKK